MGLGKTVQSIATIVSNRPVYRKGPSIPKGTLIVAPLSLLNQVSRRCDVLSLSPYYRLLSHILITTFCLTIYIIVGRRNH